MSDYLYNIYDEEVEVIENEETSETTCIFEDGTTKTFSSYDKAITKLKKIGYRF